ncbi:MAG: NAD(P)H-dependent glycerol-3-phosphate dehydrogenase [Planctomycetota bacterium]|jgi:glycerol-3-phosphate dehydrogenase (NAD(P)+)
MSVLIVGSGSWGTAVGTVLARKGEEVHLFCRDADFAATLNTKRTNEKYLPGVFFPESMTAIHSVEDWQVYSWCFCAVPTRFIREQFTAFKELWPAQLPVVSLSKGIERESLKFPTQVLSEVLNTDHAMALSGPSHAEEVAAGLPAATVSAGDSANAETLAKFCSHGGFRVYHVSDLAGVELAGAAKNVIAIAAGIIDGLKLGDNTKAALLARGLAEIVRLGNALGANERTFAGLSGVGDLYATCASPHGRNRAFGVRVGEGEKPDEVVASMTMVVEGYNTAAALKQLADRHGVEMPITEAVCEVIYNNTSPREAVERLMTRQIRAE